MSYEEDFKAALREGKDQKKKADALRDAWETKRQEIVLPVLRKAQLWLHEGGYSDAIAEPCNGSEACLRCAGHELKFGLSVEAVRVICSSSFSALGEPYEFDLFGPIHVEEKAVSFGRLIAALTSDGRPHLGWKR